MMEDVVNIVTALMLLIGAFFAFVASVGLIRLPDLYARMHAASKAGTIASGLMLLALAVHGSDVGVATRAVAGIVFLLLTAPISAHLLARAAYLTGVEPWEGTRLDEFGPAVLRERKASEGEDREPREPVA